MKEVGTDDPVLKRLLEEHDKLITKIKKWRTETVWYRWLNILLFMLSKLIVPVGALIVAMNMIGIAFGSQFLSTNISAVIAVVVTLFASLEAMLNPGAKKRLAFTLRNELDSLENKMNMARTSMDVAEVKKALVETDEEMKRLLNHYSENGY